MSVATHARTAMAADVAALAAAWRAPDPAAVELLAAGLVLILAATAVLIGCVRGRVR